MAKEVSKRSSAFILLVGVLIAVLTTFLILNHIQTPKAVNVELPSDSTARGEISLVIKEPPEDRTQVRGNINLEIKTPK